AGGPRPRSSWPGKPGRISGGSAEGGNRTHTPRGAPDFESGASASSATSAVGSTRLARLAARTTEFGGGAKRIALLTEGGDCAGLNAVTRAVTRRSGDRGHTVLAAREGWRGLVDDKIVELGPREISGILPRGGTIIGTTRTNPYKLEGGVDKVLRIFERHRLHAPVAVGGEDTPGVAGRPPPQPRRPAVGGPESVHRTPS